MFIYCFDYFFNTVNIVLNLFYFHRAKCRFFLLLVLLFLGTLLSGQVVSSSQYISLDNAKGVDKVFIFKKIDANTEIRYEGNGSSVHWSSYKDGVVREITNQSYLYPENNKGYVLDVDGQRFYYWVFDYTAYRPRLDELNVLESSSPCESVMLKLVGDVPTFSYQRPDGGQLSLERTFDVSYHTLLWENNDWKEEKKTVSVSLSDMTITLPVALTTTTFALSGDAFAKALNLPNYSITSSSYFPKAVKTHIATKTATRGELNENKRPTQSQQLDGSAPLDINFEAKSTPNVSNYLWKIYKNGELILTRTESVHSYVFEQSGNYRVKLEASTNECLDSASVEIIVTESQIYAPPVFTPNGDGKNDEFRVAYQSIVAFDATIYNRWGRVLFRWDNPQRGWDGTVHGKSVAQGTYFYVIKAKGSDGKEYELKGYFTLFR